MTEFVTIAKVGSIPAGEGATFPLADRLVAVFHHEGQYFAIDDLCPHMGASLGAGQLDEEGKVMCPWHAWRFDVCDGTWCDNPRLKIDSFPVRISGDEIQVALPEPMTSHQEPPDPARNDASDDSTSAGEESQQT
ncbi:MAG: Rieske (2Fe-2S) protein [Planctomycetota bacterium]